MKKRNAVIDKGLASWVAMKKKRTNSNQAIRWPLSRLLPDDTCFDNYMIAISLDGHQISIFITKMHAKTMASTENIILFISSSRRSSNHLFIQRKSDWAKTMTINFFFEHKMVN